MNSVSIRNRTRNTTIAPDVAVLNPPYFRLNKTLKDVLLYPAQSADTTNAKSPLDIIFISPSMTVLAIYPSVFPNTVVSPRIHADSHNYAVLELPVGTITDSQTLPGDSIGFYAPSHAPLDYTSHPVTATEDYHA